MAAGRALQQTHMCVYGGCTNVAAGASVAGAVARAKRGGGLPSSATSKGGLEFWM